MRSCNIIDAQTNHGQTQIQKLHHGPNLGEATTHYSILCAWPPGLHPNVIGSPKIL
jgi:hypothetical protein